jgi:molybdate transport system substrate-binding protein
MKRNILTVLLAFAGAGLPMGCGKSESAGGQKKELVVMCGSSFVPPCNEMVERIKAQTGVEVVMTTAGSEDFLPLVKAGQKGDILITHDPYLDEVRKANALADSAQVGFVAPVLAVQKGNPKEVKGIHDLTRPGLKVALSNPQYSTCGEMVAGLIEKKGIKDAVMKNVENRLTKGHSKLGTFLKTGTVDAVIMWNGVANTFKDSLEIVKTPYEYDTEIRVHVIGLSYSKHPELVETFVDFAKREGTNIFAKHGYVK